MIASYGELRFHWYRIGNRHGLAKLFRTTLEALAREFPEDDVDRYARGQMVGIGGILVKRCACCGVARKVENFYVDNARASGLRAKCQYCREKQNDQALALP